MPIEGPRPCRVQADYISNLVCEGVNKHLSNQQVSHSEDADQRCQCPPPVHSSAAQVLVSCYVLQSPAGPDTIPPIEQGRGP
jgi:hypothetical protein